MEYNKKFSLHKVWFFYTDDWYLPEGISEPVEFYNTLEEAEEAQLKLDIKSFNEMSSGDLFRDLLGFHEDNYKEVRQKLIEYAQSQNWDEYLIKRHFDNGNKYYWELEYPDKATNEQFAKLFEIAGAYFSKILEYKEVNSKNYVGIENAFWSEEVFEESYNKDILSVEDIDLSFDAYNYFYLINPQEQEDQSVTFSSYEQSVSVALKFFLENIHNFPENNFIGETYVPLWSEAPEILIPFLDNCKSIKLVTEIVTSENKEKINLEIKKYNFVLFLKEGDTFFQVQFPQFEDLIAEELLGLIDLLKVKPFRFVRQHLEINGETITSMDSDSSLF